jgi:hypothetical protein
VVRNSKYLPQDLEFWGIFILISLNILTDNYFLTSSDIIGCQFGGRIFQDCGFGANFWIVFCFFGGLRKISPLDKLLKSLLLKVLKNCWTK